MTVMVEPGFLYRHIDKDGALLYVGISRNPMIRLETHKRDSSWFSEIATMTIEQHESISAASVAERIAIVSEAPKYNVRGRPNHQPSPINPARLQANINAKAMIRQYGVSKLACDLNIKRQAVSAWGEVPPLRVLAVEAATGIRREVWRPDLYPMEEL